MHRSPLEAIPTRLRAAPTLSLTAALVLAAVAIAWSASSYRLISNVSAWPAIKAMTGHFHHDPLRQLTILPQLPAFLLAKLSGGADWTAGILVAWCLGWTMQPFVSLIACWAICKRARAPQAFLFPAFSFAAATMMILGSMTEVTTAVSVFWPLFLFQWIGKRGPYRTAVIILGSLALVFTHELAFLLFGVLAITALLHRKETAFAILYGAGGFVLAAHGLLSASKMGFFGSAILEPWGPMAWAAILATGTFAAAIGWDPRSKAPGKLVRFLFCGCAASIAAYALVAWWTPSTFASIDASVRLRALAPPLASLIALAALRAHLLPGRAWVALTWFAVAVLLLATFNDLAMTRRWRTGVAHLKALVAAQDRPCFVISDLDFERSLKHFEVTDAAVPILSILLQEARHPRSVAGVRSWTEAHLGLDFCSEVSKGILPIYEDAKIYMKGGGYLEGERFHPGRGGYLDFTGLTGEGTRPGTSR